MQDLNIVDGGLFESLNTLNTMNCLIPVTPMRRWGYSDRLLCCDGYPSTSVVGVRSIDGNDWPVHSLMLSLRDLRGLPLRRLSSTVPEAWLADLSPGLNRRPQDRPLYETER